MCGIAGCVIAHGELREQPMLSSFVNEMTDALEHRGPDARGTWIDAQAGVALGHRRLSIIDLSELGRQPMQSRSGRYQIVYNGEVYNFLEIRKELEAFGHSFRGGSDTEVILAAIEQWSLEGAVRRFVGMFAFAVWDAKEKSLYLVRDRLGIKPLYYGWIGKDFVFASELKSLRSHPRFKGAIDRVALARFMQYGYVPAPRSIYQGISKLPPASILKLQVSNSGPTLEPLNESPKAYWSARAVFEQGLDKQFEDNEEAAIDQLDARLRDAVGARMVSDVPIGAFLSGGIDSSLIVAMMQSLSSRPVRTFTIGFESGFYDEASHAKNVADYLGTSHTEWYVTSQEALDVIPKLPCLYDEPFADSSQIPTYLVSKLARQHVTVALSGDGGDELFAGYNRYFQAPRIWRATRLAPRFARRALARSLVGLPASTYEPLLGRLKPILPRVITSRSPSNSIQKIAQVLSSDSLAQIYTQLSSTWQPTELPLLDIPHEPLGDRTCLEIGTETSVRQMMLADLLTYHPDDILTKLDRASMGVSLEARVPIIDHRVVEFAARMPQSMLIHRGSGKRILRKLLHRYLPAKLFQRPKQGFGVPMGDWLRGPLKEWANDLLSKSRLETDGLFDATVIQRKWSDHQHAQQDWSRQLWSVLMFNAWLDQNANVPSCSPKCQEAA